MSANGAPVSRLEAPHVDGPRAGHDVVDAPWMPPESAVKAATVATAIIASTTVLRHRLAVSRDARILIS